MGGQEVECLHAKITHLSLLLCASSLMHHAASLLQTRQDSFEYIQSPNMQRNPILHVQMTLDSLDRLGVQALVQTCLVIYLEYAHHCTCLAEHWNLQLLSPGTLKM